MNVGKEEIYMAFHFDENVWYMIPKFNGYEIKRIPEGFIVRSFKNFNKYPNGDTFFRTNISMVIRIYIILR